MERFREADEIRAKAETDGKKYIGNGAVIRIAQPVPDVTAVWLRHHTKDLSFILDSQWKPPPADPALKGYLVI